jgi:hypothetical protein
VKGIEWDRWGKDSCYVVLERANGGKNDRFTVISGQRNESDREQGLKDNEGQKCTTKAVVAPRHRVNANHHEHLRDGDYDPGLDRLQSDPGITPSDDETIAS